MERPISKLRLGNWIAAAAAVAVGGGVGLLFGRNLPPQVPLFYSKPWGEEQLAGPIELVWPLGLAIGVAMVCGWIERQTRRDPVLGTMVLVSGIVVQVILIFGLLRSVMLVV